MMRRKKMRAEIKIFLSPDEVKKILPDKAKKLFDITVENLVKHFSMTEEEAKTYVANLFLKEINKIIREKENREKRKD